MLHGGVFISEQKGLRLDLQPHVAMIAIDMRSSEAGLRTSGHGRLDEAIAPGKLAMKEVAMSVITEAEATLNPKP